MVFDSHHVANTHSLSYREGFYKITCHHDNKKNKRYKDTPNTIALERRRYRKLIIIHDHKLNNPRVPDSLRGKILAVKFHFWSDIDKCKSLN